jgi:hypothetical protein
MGVSVGAYMVISCKSSSGHLNIERILALLALV